MLLFEKYVIKQIPICLINCFEALVNIIKYNDKTIINFFIVKINLQHKFKI